jgi:Uma2 family endonuclease
MATTEPRTTTLLTPDDLMALPDDGSRYELIEGELVELPMSSFESSDIAVGIASALRNFAHPRGLGRVAGADGAYIVARDPYAVRSPDASFVRADRLPPPEERTRFLELAPDLAVEVVSPSDRADDVNDKVREYLDVGVKLIWVVHPRRRMVTVYTPDRVAHLLYEDDTLDGGDVLPGFQVPVADIFT